MIVPISHKSICTTLQFSRGFHVTCTKQRYLVSLQSSELGFGQWYSHDTIPCARCLTRHNLGYARNLNQERPVPSICTLSSPRYIRTTQIIHPRTNDWRNHGLRRLCKSSSPLMSINARKSTIIPMRETSSEASWLSVLNTDDLLRRRAVKLNRRRCDPDHIVLTPFDNMDCGDSRGFGAGGE